MDLFLCHCLQKSAVGHIAFRNDVTTISVYVTFVTSLKNFKFTFKFTLTFTSTYLMEVITWVPFMQGS